MDYIEAFKNLNTNNKYSRKSPHKAILLLTVIKMYEEGVLLDNEILFNETLKSIFLKVWNRTLPDEATFLPEAYLPFWYMQSEGFWHIVPNRGKEDVLNLLRDNNVKPSETKIKEYVRYAELDEDLYFLMTLPSGRTTLKRVLLETYSSLPKKTIDMLASSVDGSVDMSSSAILEYEELVNAAKAVPTSCMKSCDNEKNSSLFHELSEDIQITLWLAYFSFLKSHRDVREYFKEIFPSVYELYNKIAYNRIQQGDVSLSFSITYENFLSDLKITLMSDEGSMELIDKINDAIEALRGVEQKPYSLEKVEWEDEHMTTVQDGSTPKAMKLTESSLSETRSSLMPGLEDRKGKAWTSEEEELISKYFQQGYNISEIAIAVGRTEISIKARLSKLGIISYTYGEEGNSVHVSAKSDDGSHLPDSEESIDFFVEDTHSRCSIFNIFGKKVFTTTGKFVIFHGRVYRFNYKPKRLVVKGMLRDGEEWKKGSNKLVASDESDLYKSFGGEFYIEDVEDFIECPNRLDNKIKVRGEWYDFNGRKTR